MKKPHLWEVLQALDRLITAAEIIDGQDYPPDKDDLEHLRLMAEMGRDMYNSADQKGIVGIN